MAGEFVRIPKECDKILTEFQLLRNEQRNIANNMNALEIELKEHKTVIETLKTVEDDRKCFRLIGGVLSERKVKDVLPQVEENNEFLRKTFKMVSEQLEKKGIEINNFKEKHNIRLRGQDSSGQNKSSSENTDQEANWSTLAV